MKNTTKTVFMPFIVNSHKIFKVGKNFKNPAPTRTIKKLLETTDHNITDREKAKIMNNLDMVAIYANSQDIPPNRLYLWLSNHIDNTRTLASWKTVVDARYEAINTDKAVMLLDAMDEEVEEEIDSTALMSMVLGDKDTKIIGEEIECTRVLINSATGEYSYEYRTIKTTFVLEAKDLASPTRVSEALTKKGVLVSPHYLKDMLEFLFLIARDRMSDEVVALSTQLGWDEKGKFVLPFSEGEAFSDSVFYNEAIEDNYKAKGDIKREEEMIRKLSPNRCFLTVLAVLASPILPMIREVKENPILNLFGTTGSGKTEVLTAISRGLFVDPESSYESWGSTENYRMAYALENNNLPVIIDETKKIRDKRELPRELYTLFEGHDKGRATPKSGIVGTRGVRKFRSVVVITSESSTDTLISSGVKDGVQDDGIHRRVLDYRVDQTEWFGQLTKNDTIDLKLLMMENHGNFGRMWIEYIHKNKDEIIKDYRDIRAKRNEDLGFKEALLYLFEVVLNILEKKGLVKNKEQHIKWIYEDIEENKRLRKDIRYPHKRFLNELKEAIHATPHNFGGLGSAGREQYAKIYDGVAYFTKSSLNKFLREVGIYGEKEAIVKGLTEVDNYRETKQTDFGIDGNKDSSRTRIRRVAIVYDAEQLRFKGFTLKGTVWVSDTKVGEEYEVFVDDKEGREKMRNFIEENQK